MVALSPLLLLLFSLTILEHIQKKPPGELVVMALMGDSSLMKLKRWLWFLFFFLDICIDACSGPHRIVHQLRLHQSIKRWFVIQKRIMHVTLSLGGQGGQRVSIWIGDFHFYQEESQPFKISIDGYTQVGIALSVSKSHLTHHCLNLILSSESQVLKLQRFRRIF